MGIQHIEESKGLKEEFEKEFNWIDKKEHPMFISVKYVHWLEDKIKQLQNTLSNNDYIKCRELLRKCYIELERNGINSILCDEIEEHFT